MSELKFCEDCTWFVSGHGYAFPYDRCSNPIAVEDGQYNLAHRQVFTPCIDARSPDAACGTLGKLFQVRPPKPPKVSMFRRIFFGKRS